MPHYYKIFIISLITLIMSSTIQAMDDTTAYTTTILNLEDGLTLAHVKSQDGADQTVLVISDKQRVISGLNLSELSGINGSPIELYQKIGYDEMIKITRNNQTQELFNYPYAMLQSPAGNTSHHLGMGFNYAKHAGEVDAEEQPFMFIKATLPSRDGDIPSSEGSLLDYEVELCARPLDNIREPQQTIDSMYAFYLCGDFTDRALLLQNMDVNNPQSGKGFSTAKSQSLFFPTGPYLVIPKNQKQFLDQVSIRLKRNGELKQQEKVSRQTWPLKKINAEAFRRERENIETHSPYAKHWLPNQQLDPSISLLTGTPAGVIIRPPSLSFRIRYGILWFLSASFLDQSPIDYVVEHYIAYLQEQKSFLQKGEKIVLEGDYLGIIDVSIE